MRRSWLALALLILIGCDQGATLQEKRFRGIWLDQFEGSRYFDGAHDASRVKASIRHDAKTFNANREWLGWNDQATRDLIPSAPRARLVAIDFIGRRMAYPGRYGHMGISRRAIIVDRVLSARLIYQASTPYLAEEPAR